MLQTVSPAEEGGAGSPVTTAEAEDCVGQVSYSRDIRLAAYQALLNSASRHAGSRVEGDDHDWSGRVAVPS